MIVDAHQHFWKYNRTEYDWIDDALSALRRDFLPADAKKEMDAAGIDACIAVQARQTIDETRWLLQLAEAHPFIAGVVGWVDLQAEDVRDQLEEFAANPRLVGIRHVVQTEPDDRFLLKPAFCRGISLLDDLELAYDILIYPKHLQVADEFVSRFTHLRFVLDHMAKPDIRGGEIRDWERGIRRLAQHPCVYCKVSGLVTEADWHNWTRDQIDPYLDVVFDCFGPNRLIAGSDWPVCNVAGGYARAMSVVTDYLSRRGIAAAERDEVLGGTAQRVWRLRGAHARQRAEPNVGELV
jgi:L-fuconolactonase